METIVKYIFIGKRKVVLFHKLKVIKNQRESAVSALNINSSFILYIRNLSNYVQRINYADDLCTK
jgi:hypothetical protein